jgi:uncharacterized protein
MPSSEISKSNSTRRSKRSSGNLLTEIFVNIAIVFIDIYRGLFSGLFETLFGVRCRFTPTCSVYARDAFRIYGVRKGLAKTATRLLRCHPWGECGSDPVTPAENIIKEAPTRGT